MTEKTVRFPDVTVQLSGEDGNAFFILGKVFKALCRAGATNQELKEFDEQAKCGDYNNLLRTCMEWVNVK